MRLNTAAQSAIFHPLAMETSLVILLQKWKEVSGISLTAVKIRMRASDQVLIMVR